MVSEQSIQDGINAIVGGEKFDQYMNEYVGPEDKDELSLAIRCKIIENYPDNDIVGYAISIEAHISGMVDGPGKTRYQTILDALNAEKIKRNL